MPSLHTVGDRYQSRFRLDTGVEFYGIIDQIGDEQQPSYQFNQPRRALRVRDGALIQPRDVFLTPAGQRFLVADNGAADLRDRVLYRTYRLFELDTQLPWGRNLTVTDTLTKQQRFVGKQHLGDVWCALEPVRDYEDRQLSIEQSRFRCFTAESFQLNDTLGPYTVQTVTSQLGVTVAEVQ